MSFGKYIVDKISMLLLNGMAVFLLSIYLTAVKNSPTTVLLIIIIWILVLGIVLCVNFLGRKRYFDRLNDLIDHLEKPYLIQEFMGASWKLEDRIYKEILRCSNKAVIEKIHQLEDERKEYREFIEGWIHEVKLPITGLWLLCHNEIQDESRRFEIYLEEMDHAVERVLFYARSNQVYKDFQVSETNLRHVVTGVISKNKCFLIQNQMSVQVEVGDVSVITDKKWLEFILTQIVSNAVKYKKEGGGEIRISIGKSTNDVMGGDAANEVYTALTIRDLGIGIPSEDLERIFEKGFTGSNGRNREKSTGIGLYLCCKLCRKLEINIRVESVENEYTEVSLIFTKNSYLSKL